MPILTFTTSDHSSGGTLNSRVLIGRRISYGIAFSDPSVSRLHAWIDPVASEEADWVITDAGSKTGTFVNDQKITRHHLQDGDVIRVGKSTLKYHEQDSLPDGVASINLIAPPPVVRDQGILFECSCGSPLWVGNELAGKRGMCRHCRQPVTVPGLEPTPQPSPPEPISPPPLAVSRIETAPIAEIETIDPPPTIVSDGEVEYAASPLPSAEPLGSLGSANPAAAKKLIPSIVVDATTKRKNKCAVCHGPIVPGEEMVTCPDCAMCFHAECWQENLGCSSYGCPQVNCLQPAPPISSIADVFASENPVVEEHAGSTRWEPILLAGSVIGSILGSLLFGGLAAIIAVISLVVLLQKKPGRSGLLIGAILICVVGIAAGLAVSDFYYFDARHLPPVVARHMHF